MRRPRTLFFTPDTRWEAQMADLCWILPKKPGGECKADDPRTAWPDVVLKGETGSQSLAVKSSDVGRGRSDDTQPRQESALTAERRAPVEATPAMMESGGVQSMLDAIQAQRKMLEERRKTEDARETSSLSEVSSTPQQQQRSSPPQL